MDPFMNQGDQLDQGGKVEVEWSLGSNLYLSLSVSGCLCLLVSFPLGQCHHQMISFRKIYGLYGLEHHTVEINGDVTLGDGHTLHTYIHTYGHVNIVLEFCEQN